MSPQAPHLVPRHERPHDAPFNWTSWSGP